MHFQFLIEDQSGKPLIDAVMNKVKESNEALSYDCKSFRGIGGFTNKNTVKETKTGKLLNDLATYLRGFNKSLRYSPSAVFVVLDNDDRDTEPFRNELNAVAIKNNISIDYVFCIAVEEVEAWLLGDESALQTAYSCTKIPQLHSYIQDSICGTWEFLADIIYPGGCSKMKKDCPSYMEIGKQKSEWAHNIGIHLDLSRNKSPSFNYFINEINKRVSPVECN